MSCASGCSRAFNPARNLTGYKPGQGYSWLPFHGLYSEDGRLLRLEGGQSETGQVPARKVPTPYRGCSQGCR